jgi:uncharacterized protein
MVHVYINDDSGFFFIEVDGKTEAKMTFKLDGNDKIIIYHTEVNQEHNAKGFGKLMVKKAVEYAREKNIKIVPLCSFTKSIIDKTPDYQDIT